MKNGQEHIETRTYIILLWQIDEKLRKTVTLQKKKSLYLRLDKFFYILIYHSRGKFICKMLSTQLLTYIFLDHEFHKIL